MQTQLDLGEPNEQILPQLARVAVIGMQTCIFRGFNKDRNAVSDRSRERRNSKKNSC